MEQIDFDETYNGQQYQIVSRLNPAGEDGISSITTLYLISGREFSEREWDMCLMADKKADIQSSADAPKEES